MDVAIEALANHKGNVREAAVFLVKQEQKLAKEKLAARDAAKKSESPALPAPAAEPKRRHKQKKSAENNQKKTADPLPAAAPAAEPITSTTDEPKPKEKKCGKKDKEEETPEPLPSPTAEPVAPPKPKEKKGGKKDKEEETPEPLPAPTAEPVAPPKPKEKKGGKKNKEETPEPLPAPTAEPVAPPKPKEKKGGKKDKEETPEPLPAPTAEPKTSPTDEIELNEQNCATKDKKEKKDKKDKKDKKGKKEKKDKASTAEPHEKRKAESSEENPVPKKRATVSTDTPSPRPKNDSPESTEKHPQEKPVRDLNPESLAKFFDADTYRKPDDKPNKLSQMERTMTVASIHLDSQEDSQVEKQAAPPSDNDPAAAHAASPKDPSAAAPAKTEALPAANKQSPEEHTASNDTSPPNGPRGSAPVAPAPVAPAPVAPAPVAPTPVAATPTPVATAKAAQGSMHPALVAKWNASDDDAKFGMLKEWMLNDGKLGAIRVEESYKRIVENTESDHYVTMTVLQLEKEFGDSPDAQEFIAELISGQKGVAHPQAPNVKKARMYRVLRFLVDERRRSNRTETSTTVGGLVTDDAAKKSIAEKIKAPLAAMEGTEYFDRETGRIKLKKPKKEPKETTAEEKMVSDYRGLIRKFKSFDEKITVEGCFKKNLSAEQLKPFYDKFMAQAVSIDDDLKEDVYGMVEEFLELIDVNQAFKLHYVLSRGSTWDHKLLLSCFDNNSAGESTASEIDCWICWGLVCALLELTAKAADSPWAGGNQEIRLAAAYTDFAAACKREKIRVNRYGQVAEICDRGAGEPEGS
ncbi:unnamed protein product [Symbiodinium sp. CCMP2592]|nr:unnamed protein product [Symbiodinium sp. CCMP2592]CAE7650510.1 unnamed protein product [Symbiodinium sp. CCMP2592]